MALAFLEKFKKEVAKLDSVGVGIKTTEEWLSTGNYALNHALSGDFKRGIPLSKLSGFMGPSGSGKSTTIRCMNRLEPFPKRRVSRCVP